MRQDVRSTTRERVLSGVPISDHRYALAGVPTAVLEGGAGPPIVLLHAEGEFAAVWTTVIPDLLHTHRLIAPDLPGHGASDAAGPLDVAHTLGWLAELVERTCAGPPTLVGRGLGAAIAARAAIAGRPLAGLVLSSALGLAEFAPAPSFAAAVEAFSAQPNPRTRDLMFAQCFADLDGLRRRMGERWDPIADYALQRSGTPQMQAALAGLMPAFLPPTPAADLSGIAVPTTLIWGREDLHVPLPVAEEAHHRYGWPLHVIDDAGDDPPMEQPQAYLAALRAAIATQSERELL
jgi:pimeloyl-ACP methyl ester carboxylesterase